MARIWVRRSTAVLLLVLRDLRGWMLMLSTVRVVWMRVLAVALALVLWPSSALAQGETVSLAAPSDCLVNSACGVGFRSVYGLDARSAFTPPTVADAGVSALDDGLAEVAVAFSSDPQLSRPDVVTLTDDKHMGYA